MEWQIGAVGKLHRLAGDDPGEAGHALVGAAVAVACQDWADEEGRVTGHELSHHIGGRGGGCGLRTPQVIIRPPQQGQTSTS